MFAGIHEIDESLPNARSLGFAISELNNDQNLQKKTEYKVNDTYLNGNRSYQNILGVYFGQFMTHDTSNRNTVQMNGEIFFLCFFSLCLLLSEKFMNRCNFL